jgi:carbamoyl-phosphate synthase large subunit
MEIIYEPHDLERYVRRAFAASPDRPLLIDRFLEDAIEVDVDAVSDGRDVVIGGIMEHIERAGVHSGDSACALPPTSIDAEVQAEIRRQTIAMARELGVVGLMNVQYAVQNRRVFILEVNPRASRTVPFVSKAIGVPLAKIAARVMAGKTLVELGFTREIVPAHVSVKEAVFPFLKFPGVDTVLGPEMKSTGEVMGIGPSFGVAFAKAEVAAGTVLPGAEPPSSASATRTGPGVVPTLHGDDLAIRILGTVGTASELTRAGVPAETINKVSAGSPHVVDALEAGTIALVINTPRPDAQELRDSFSIRRTALERKIPYFTTIAGALAAAEAIGAMAAGPLGVKAVQAYHAELAGTSGS